MVRHYNGAMLAPVLAAKLFCSPASFQDRLSIPPDRAVERGSRRRRRLTLISAPAGFGKTTLVSEWVAGCGRPVAWLSLDEGDNDPARFLTYLVAALQTIAANIGEGVLAVLQSPQPPPTESILTALLNEITTIPDNFILVLDDYHVIDSKPVDDALTFLLEHLPPQMHLVIATREDPHLPLARLRARGQLTELRAADLRFTPSEAAEFLNQVMGLNLSAEDIAAPGNPHRRLDRRAAISRAFHAGQPGCFRVHSGIRWRPPVHRGLSGRRGSAKSARTYPQIPAPDRHSRSVEWLAV